MKEENTGRLSLNSIGKKEASKEMKLTMFKIIFKPILQFKVEKIDLNDLTTSSNYLEMFMKRDRIRNEVIRKGVERHLCRYR